MAVQHVSLPMAAVQFHPESILTRTDLGLQMLRNALSQLRY
jgi:anthranilate synthase